MSKLNKETTVTDTPLGTIYRRKKVWVATIGSLRRCYNGCFHHDDWRMEWTAWDELETNMPEDRLTFWNYLSEPTTQTQYKWEPNT